MFRHRQKTQQKILQKNNKKRIAEFNQNVTIIANQYDKDKSVLFS